MTARIKGIADGSISQEIGIEAGDILLAINGSPVTDILDYEFYAQDDTLNLEIQKSDGEIWSIDIEKDYDEKLGLEFDGVVFDKMKQCKNKCVFCFIDQLPPHMRSTLYIKDDDYRYSFLYGNFITLTNLKESDWRKIEIMKLSPLYISVHCMRPQLRAQILNNPAAARIKEDLQRLQQAGIEVHTQIVLCPGINDGSILQETISELANLPTVVSIGIVPVGLTGHRQKLPPLRPITAQEATETIALVDACQKKFRASRDTGLVYLADEFYLKAGQDFPPADYYDDYCQIENGIGLARMLLDECEAIEPELPAQVIEQEVYILTGLSGLPILQRIVERLNRIKGLSVSIITVPNKYFGGSVSVTGLLTGTDILAVLGDSYAGKKIILPEVVLKQGQDILLDDLSLQDLQRISQAQIITVDGTAADLIQSIIDI